MTPLAAALAAGWGGLALAVAWRHRPSTMARSLPPAPSPFRGPTGGTGRERRHRSRGRRRPSAGGLDPAVARLLGRLRRRPVDAVTARRLVVSVMGGLVALVVLPPLVPAAAAAPWGWPVLRERRRRRARLAAVSRHLPDAVDLFVLAVGAGLTVPLAVDAVARRAPDPIGAALRRAVEEVRLGRRLADALDRIPTELGEPVRPLVAALVASERYGAPLLDRLVRLSGEVRADRRRRAEEAARRVPVKLLFPLVFCTLPAFALLTVVPLLAGALRALRL